MKNNRFTLPALRLDYFKCFSIMDAWNGELVTGEALKYFRQIERQLQKFTVMSDDELRTLWLRVESQGERFWIAVSISSYRGVSHMFLADKKFSMLHLRTYDERLDKGSVGYDQYADYLKSLSEQLVPITEAIVNDVDGYNNYVERYLPYGLRNGKISRKALNEIAPEFRVVPNDMEAAREALRVSLNKEYPVFDKMNLRLYSRYYRFAYEHFYDKPHDSKMDDVAFYVRHKFLNARDVDPDSEAYFKSIAHDHYSELGLSRMDVYATDWNDGKWKIGLSVCYSAHMTYYLNLAADFYKAGMPVKLNDAKIMTEALDETDYVGFTTSSFHDYIRNGGVTEKISLDSDFRYIENARKRNEVRRRIIKAAQWEPQEKVSLL